MSGNPKDQRVPEDFHLHPTWLSSTWQGGGQAQNQHLAPVRLCWGIGYRQASRGPQPGLLFSRNGSFSWESLAQPTRRTLMGSQPGKPVWQLS